MKKNLFLLSLITIILASCSSNNELKSWELNGKVKSVFERMYEVDEKFGKWEAGDLMHTIHNKVNFDENGLYQGMEYYGYDMKLSMKIIPKRENGTIIEEIHYDEDGRLQSKTKINRISKNEIEAETFNHGNELIYRNKITQKDGRAIKVVQTIIKDGEESEIYTMSSEYDKNGNLKSHRRTNKKGETDFHIRFEYLEFDQKKNWVKKLMYEDGNEPEYISIREIEYY